MPCLGACERLPIGVSLLLSSLPLSLQLNKSLKKKAKNTQGVELCSRRLEWINTSKIT